MSKVSQNKPEMSATANADIGLVAKASYTQKKNISQVIPPDVTRAKAAAWLDLISPVTEWAGLRGDQLRHRREQLRLQREDTLAEIARRWHEQVRPGTLAPIPTKFIVPFLERASLEDPGGVLVEFWTNLLLSASENFDSKLLHFVNVISHLSPRQAEILKEVMGAESLRDLEAAVDNISMYYEQNSMRRTVLREYTNAKKVGGRWTDDDFANFIHNLMSYSAISVVHAAAENKRTKAYFDVTFDYATYKDEQEADYLILDSLGLIRRVELDFFDIGRWSVGMTYYYMTRLGFHFARSCKILPDNSMENT